MAGNSLNTYAIVLNNERTVAKLKKNAIAWYRTGFRFVIVTQEKIVGPYVRHMKHGHCPDKFDAWRKRTIVDELGSQHGAGEPHSEKDRAKALRSLVRAEHQMEAARAALSNAEEALDQAVRGVAETHGVALRRDGKDYQLRYKVDSYGFETVYYAPKEKPTRHPRFSDNGLDTV